MQQKFTLVLPMRSHYIIVFIQRVSSYTAVARTAAVSPFRHTRPKCRLVSEVRPQAVAPPAGCVTSGGPARSYFTRVRPRTRDV